MQPYDIAGDLRKTANSIDECTRMYMPVHILHMTPEMKAKCKFYDKAFAIVDRMQKDASRMEKLWKKVEENTQ